MAFMGLSSGAEYPFDITRRQHTYRVPALNQQDLDRNMCLSTSNLLKWMQAARMELPWMQPGYRNLCEVKPEMTRRMLVASQGISLVKPGVLGEAAMKEVATCVEIGEIGKTSIEFLYTIFFDNECVAFASTVMIVTAGTPGNLKPSPVPDDVRALGRKSSTEEPRSSSDEILRGREQRLSLNNVPKEVPSGSYRTTASVRFSDEDVNGHANHSTQARFFEDAKETLANDETAPAEFRALARQHLDAIAITYLLEAHALDNLEISLAKSATNPQALDVWVCRLQPKPGLVARGRLTCGGPGLERFNVKARL
eukprot:TRINITY_DN4132_c0_g1_i1.p1 TRINITY_DN4132_c0_g1~~TRINITY_DN4132_c0_g1_i1.p1  ORF type:complete len:333 (+),score=62.57 TRINITY_DN4132_c0_g1_i1:67-999(+)